MFRETSRPATAISLAAVQAQAIDPTGHTHVWFPLAYPGEGQLVPPDVDASQYPKVVPLGTTSTDDDHSHAVLGVINLEPVQQELPDPTRPEGTQTTLVAFRERLVEYQFDDLAGHTHVPGGEIPKGLLRDRSKDKKRAEEVFKNVYDLRKTAIDFNNESYKKADEAEKFIHNEQWPSKTGVEVGDDDCTPELTMNHTASIINVISGIQRNARTDPQFFPVEGGDERVANILDVVEKDLLTQSNFALEQSLAFEDAAGPGIGVIHVTSELSPELTEDVKIRRLDWKLVHPGPHSHVLTEDMLHVHVDEMVTKRELALLYPDHEDEIDELFDAGAMINTGGTEDPTEGDVYITNSRVPLNTFREMAGVKLPNDLKKPSSPDLAVIDFTARAIKLVTSYIKERLAVPVAVGIYGDPINLEGIKATYIRRIRSIPEFTLVDVPQCRIHRICWAGSIILRDDITELTGDYLPVFIYYGKKIREKFYGKAAQLMDMQRFYNKLSSLLIDALTRSAHGNREYDDETFAGDEQRRDDYAKNMGRSNSMLWVADVNRPPRLVENDKFPFDLAQGKQDLLNEMRLVSNVNPEMLGMAAYSRETQGAAADRIQQALLGNEFLFENLKFQTRRLYKALVYSIRHIYKDNPSALVRILGSHVMREEVQVGQQKFGPEAPIDPQTMLALEQLLTTTDLLKHDVVCEESSQSPTIRMKVFEKVMNLVSTGAMPMLPEFTDLFPIPKDMKEKMKVAIQNNQAAQQAAQELPYKTEILKTQIKNKQGGVA